MLAVLLQPFLLIHENMPTRPSN